MTQGTIWTNGRMAVRHCLGRMGPSELTPGLAERTTGIEQNEDLLSALLDLFKLAVFSQRRNIGQWGGRVNEVFVGQLDPLIELAVQLTWPTKRTLESLVDKLNLFDRLTFFFNKEQAVFCRALKGGFIHDSRRKEEVLRVWIEALTLPFPLEDVDRQFLHDSIREHAETFGPDLLYRTALDFTKQHSPPFPGVREFTEVLDSLTQTAVKLAKRQSEGHQLIGTLRQYKKPNLDAYQALADALARGVTPDQIVAALAAIEAPALPGTDE